MHHGTVVDISIPPPSFKPVPLSLSRISFYSKNTPNKSFFNPIKYIFEHLLPHTLFTDFYNSTFFSFNVQNFYFTVFSCLFDFSVFSVLSLILAIRCLLDSDHIHLKVMHQQMKRRWVAQLGYTLFTLGIRILYQCPFFEKKYKRSSSLISLGLTKVGKFLSEGAAREWSTVVIVIVIFMS